MARIVDEIEAQAAWIAEALQSSGYRADFSPESLWEVDRFFDENSRAGKALTGKLLSNDLGARMFALGCYVGEVLRRTLVGEWHGDDADPQAEVNVELRLSDGSIYWPVQRVMKRYSNGEGEGIAAYGAAFGLSVGAMPTPRLKKPWWKLR